MMQDNLRTMGSSVEAIRIAIKAGNSHVDMWKVYYKSHNLDERVMATDYEGRWNSTFIILDKMLAYIEVYTNGIHEELRDELFIDKHWIDVEATHMFIKVFFDVTNALSTSETPTSLNTMHKLYEMSKVLKIYEDRETLGTTVASTKEVWKKYFFPMLKLYEYAFILDSIIRLPTLRSMYIILDRML